MTGMEMYLWKSTNKERTASRISPESLLFRYSDGLTDDGR